MGRELDEAYFQSCECTRYEPLLGKMVQAINRLEKAYETGASVTVGTTNTLDPGQEAYVVNSGTDKRARLQFGIPRGEKGADGTPGKDGTPGAKGDKGDKGDSYTITEADYDAIAAITESDLQPKLDAKANIASPAFTGIPTVPYTNSYNAGRIVNMRMLQEGIAGIESYPVGIKSFDEISGDGVFSVIEYTNGKKYLIGSFNKLKFEDVELLVQIDSGLFAGGVYPQLNIFNANINVGIELNGMYVDNICSSLLYVFRNMNINIAFANVTGFNQVDNTLKLNVVVATSDNIENLTGLLHGSIIAELV